MVMTNAYSTRVRQALRQQLESLQAAGVGQLPKAKPRPRVEQVAEAPRTQRPIATPTGGLFAMEPASESAASTAPTLDVLQQEVAGCTLCGELARTRTQTVFGVGNPREVGRLQEDLAARALEPEVVSFDVAPDLARDEMRQFGQSDTYAHRHVSHGRQLPHL